MESLKEALAKAHRTFSDRNPASHQAYLISRNHLPGGNTRTVLHANPFPITFAAGNGCTLTSVDGHRYIDFLSEYTAGIYGHSNAAVRTAITDALNQGWSLGGNTVYEKELAKLVCERFQPTVELVRFTNSGTEANMMAVATAMAWTGRKKILVFQGGYHGATLSFRTPPAGVPQQDMNLPHEWVVGTYNDVASNQRLLSSLPPNSLAAILVEPMLGSGGAIPGSLTFLQFLRSYASSHGALLIFDEVMTSRLSYRGLGHKLGIQPDMMTLGKYLGGGMSSGAFGGRADIMAMYDPTKNGGVAHPGTFNNNVISMAGGCAGCKVLDEQTTNRLNDLGELLKGKVQCAIDEGLGFKRASDSITKSVDGVTNGVEELKTDTLLDPPMYITGIGSILSIHLPSPELLSLFYHHMLSEGIYVAERGFIALNIELGVADVERFVTGTEKFVERYKGLITQT
ncbi:MAG: hypothetical protein Q9208_000260 [Pyrenodesmia sp. 3 TL-2023]